MVKVWCIHFLKWPETFVMLSIMPEYLCYPLISTLIYILIKLCFVQLTSFCLNNWKVMFIIQTTIWLWYLLIIFISLYPNITYIFFFSMSLKFALLAFIFLLNRIFFIIRFFSSLGEHEGKFLSTFKHIVPE